MMVWRQREEGGQSQLWSVVIIGAATMVAPLSQPWSIDWEIIG